jgi:hypothetical protein
MKFMVMFQPGIEIAIISPIRQIRFPTRMLPPEPGVFRLIQPHLFEVKPGMPYFLGNEEHIVDVDFDASLDGPDILTAIRRFRLTISFY